MGDMNLARSSVSDGVGYLWLADAGRKNAVTVAMRHQVASLLNTLVADPEVRCLVLNAEGDAFCAGIALSDLEFLADGGSMDPARRSVQVADFVGGFQDWVSAFERCPKPIIAAIHGACIGAGVDIITACDIRMCSKQTVFSVREARVGLCADVGTLQRLPKVTGCHSWVRDLAFTGRDFGAEEALQHGLVQEVLDDVNALNRRVEALAKQIATNSPVAVQATKASLIFSRDHGVTDGLEHVKLMNQVYLQAPDMLLAVQAAKSKKPAAFPNMPKISKL